MLHIPALSNIYLKKLLARITLFLFTYLILGRNKVIVNRKHFFAIFKFHVYFVKAWRYFRIIISIRYVIGHLVLKIDKITFEIC